jgi:hypothetical protein
VILWSLLSACAIGLLAPCILPALAQLHAAQSGEPGTIEIYENYGPYTLDAPPPEMRPIILQVPERFRYGSSRGATRNWGLNLLTYYPSFTSPADPENAKFGLNCAGVCNGRILICIENRAHSIHAPNQFDALNMGDFIAQSTLKWKKTPPYPPYVHVFDLSPPEGLDEAFEQIITKVEDAPNIIPGHFATVHRFYFKRDETKTNYNLAVICSVFERTTCELHFSLACNPAVYVTVSWLDSQYLPQSADIKNRTDQFVSAMIKVPPCKD